MKVTYKDYDLDEMVYNRGIKEVLEESDDSYLLPNLIVLLHSKDIITKEEILTFLPDNSTLS